MNEATTQRPQFRWRLKLAFSLLGGPLAWFLHLFLAWFLAEWGCLRGFPALSVFGLGGTVVLLVVVTIPLTAIALAATMLSLQMMRAAEEPPADGAGLGQSSRFTARTGAVTGGIFTAAILFESIPLLFYLSRC